MTRLSEGWMNGHGRWGKWIFLLLLACCVSVFIPPSFAEGRSSQHKAFFNPTNIHTILLVFPEQQWAAIEPKRISAPRFGFGGGGEGMNLSPEGAKKNGVTAMMGLEFDWVHADAEID